MTKSRRDLGIERMGTYMLGGWILTDANCKTPQCNVPTFRSRDGTKVNFCCLCHDPKNPVPIEVTEQAQPAFDDQTNAETLDKFGDQPEQDDDVRPPPVSLGASESDRVSAMMGQKLLAGWTMLSTTCSKCHITPLMEKGGLSVCVKCGSDSQVNVVHPQKFAKITENVKLQRDETEIEDAEDEEFWNELLESAPASKYTVIPPPGKKQLKREQSSISYQKPTQGSSTVVVVLEQQLQSLTASLSHVGANYAESRAICEAIKACAEAIESCRRI
ncbi:UNVERIFIED_CONTAM: hypothetical protein HDU68_007313 [Siphonaria sp. JEL0065]|nr:hypothetical protein HDU68_007313 [Siphonaria sp. JEL0065]